MGACCVGVGVGRVGAEVGGRGGCVGKKGRRRGDVPCFILHCPSIRNTFEQTFYDSTVLYCSGYFTSTLLLHE